MKARLLRRVPLFKSLSDGDLERILNLTNFKKYSRDDVILFESEEGSLLFIIAKGSVKISRISDKGKEVILAILRSGDFFGELSLLDNQKRSANVIAIEDSELLVLRREDFLDIIKKHPLITISLLRELAKRIRSSDFQIKSLSLMNSTGKVAATIYQLVSDWEKNKEGRVEIKNLPSQQNLAGMSGTSRETISRVLRDFAKNGLIERSGKDLIINDMRQFQEMFK